MSFSVSPPPSQQQFFLKTVTIASTSDSSGPNSDSIPNPAEQALYLRHHGSGHNEIMLMPSPPKFIRGHFVPSSGSNNAETGGGRIIFTSPSHSGRWWGLVLRRCGGKKAGWDAVEIVENEADDGFWFNKESESGDGSVEVLSWRAPNDTVVTEKGEWRGWLAMDWSLGHRQLFWITDAESVDGDGREFGVDRLEKSGLGRRVEIVRESIPPVDSK